MIGSYEPFYSHDTSQLQPWSQSYSQSWPIAKEHNAYFQYAEDDDDARGSRYPYPRQHRQRSYHMALLRNAQLVRQGDLGWSLAYATAYCFRHLNTHRIAVAGIIDDVRSLTIDENTAYVLFGLLDKHLFQKKLSGMVHLRWAPMEAFSPGITSAAGLRAGRITIQLNRSPFTYGFGDIDTLLEMLIHQMIHAYFLVCCGAQKEGEKADGRLLDDLHFGVILMTIQDITRDCKTGPFHMSFYAADRDSSQREVFPASSRGFIALDPTATSFDPGLVTGRTCCHRDNRHVRIAQIRNWQVEGYSKALHENWDSRGLDIIYFKNGMGTRIRRLHGPPSNEYSELICQKERVIIRKERAQKFSALKRLADDSKHADIKVPDCPATVLNALWQFIQFGEYSSRAMAMHHSTDIYGSGPPILYEGRNKFGPVGLHIQVCRVATAMKFPELQQLAIKHLYTVSSTSEDPIVLLAALYEPAPAMCMDLQGWARKFLAKTDGGSMHPSGIGIGVSNYEKIISWHRKRFYEELWGKFPAFKDDVRLAVGTMNSSFTWETDDHAPLTGQNGFDDRNGFEARRHAYGPEYDPAYRPAYRPAYVLGNLP